MRCLFFAIEQYLLKNKPMLVIFLLYSYLLIRVFPFTQPSHAQIVEWCSVAARSQLVYTKIGVDWLSTFIGKKIMMIYPLSRILVNIYIKTILINHYIDDSFISCEKYRDNRRFSGIFNVNEWEALSVMRWPPSHFPLHTIFHALSRI